MSVAVFNRALELEDAGFGVKPGSAYAVSHEQCRTGTEG